MKCVENNMLFILLLSQPPHYMSPFHMHIPNAKSLLFPLFCSHLTGWLFQRESCDDDHHQQFSISLSRFGLPLLVNFLPSSCTGEVVVGSKVECMCSRIFSAASAACTLLTYNYCIIIIFEFLNFFPFSFSLRFS